jgi:hypothetical protein
MRMHAAFTTLVLAVTALASDHHALNGTWVLIPAQSNFGGQEPFQTGSVTINDREGNITITRDFTYDRGNETLSYSFSSDGRENSTIKNGKTFKTKARWDHGVLKVTTTQADEITVERFSLTPDGDMLLDVERAGHPPLALVLRRK